MSRQRHERDGRQKVTMELPVDIVEKLKDSDQPMWKEADEKLRFSYGLDEVSAEQTHRRHLENIRDEIQQMEEQLETMQNNLENLRDREEFHEKKLQEALEKKDSFEEIAQDVITQLEEAPERRINGFKKKIRKMAVEKYGQPTAQNREQVIEDVWELAMENGADVSRIQFEDPVAAGPAERAMTDGTGDDDGIPESLRKLSEDESDQEADD